MSGVIIEIEGSVRLRYKRALFTMKNSKKDTSDLNNPYFHSIFTLLLIEQIFKIANRRRHHPKAGCSFDIELPLHASVDSKFKL